MRKVITFFFVKITKKAKQSKTPRKDRKQDTEQSGHYYTERNYLEEIGYVGCCRDSFQQSPPRVVRRRLLYELFFRVHTSLIKDLSLADEIFPTNYWLTNVRGGLLYGSTS